MTNESLTSTRPAQDIGSVRYRSGSRRTGWLPRLCIGLTMLSVGSLMWFTTNASAGHITVEGTVVSERTVQSTSTDADGNTTKSTSEIATISFTDPATQTTHTFEGSGQGLEPGATPMVAFDPNDPANANVVRPLISAIGRGIFLGGIVVLASFIHRLRRAFAKAPVAGHVVPGTT